MSDQLSKVVPPEAVPVKDDAMNFGVVQPKDWVIPTSCGVRVVDERMAYGWNECRKSTIARIESAAAPVGVVDEDAALDAFDAACNRHSLANGTGPRVTWVGYTREDRLRVIRAALQAAQPAVPPDWVLVPMPTFTCAECGSGPWAANLLQRTEQAESALAAANAELVNLRAANIAYASDVSNLYGRAGLAESQLAEATRRLGEVEWLVGEWREAANGERDYYSDALRAAATQLKAALTKEPTK